MKKLLATLFAFIIMLSLHITVFATNVTVLDNCDHGDYWQRMKIDEEDKREGEACVISLNNANTFFTNTFSKPINPAVKEKDAYFEMWIYIDNVSRLDKDGQIELNSLYEPDKQEYHWIIKDLGLKNGWNYLSLKISEAGKDGKPDFTMLSMIRIYQITSEPITMKIDNFIITDTPTKVDPSLLGESKIDNSSAVSSSTDIQVTPPVTDITGKVFIVVGLSILSLALLLFIVLRVIKGVKK